MSYILEKEVRDMLAGSIYKYGPVSYVDRTLVDSTLGFSALSDFNDIYESEYRLTHFFESNDEMDKWTKGPVTPFERIKDLARNYLESVRVTCFSYSATNNLMWSHYSDHHKGVCYCFDFSNTTKTPFSPKNVGWGNVIYSSLIPEIQVFQNSTTEGILEMLLSNVALTKASEWAYEQEVRFFLRQDEKKLNYRPESLKAIIIGRRMSEKDIQDLSKHVANFNNANNTSVKVLYAHRVASKYDLGIHTNKNFRDNSEDSFNCRIPVLTGINSPVVTRRK
jgi:hypothetical protein